MNEKEKMLAGLPYKPWLDGLSDDRDACALKVYEYNILPPNRWGEREELLKSMLGYVGENVNIRTPFICEYGYPIEIGDGTFANYGLTILDAGGVKIGRNVQIAPNVSIYTSGHPVHPDTRNSFLEYAERVEIGDNCWLGGGVSIMPGVRIGENTVIGGGSVVTKDIPSGVIAAGNPCRVIREITDDDRGTFYKGIRATAAADEE